MARALVGVLALLPLPAILAVSWDGPQSTHLRTLPSRTLYPATTNTTPPPRLASSPPSIGNATDQYEPPQLCGYVDFNSANSYTCGGQNTCFWNPRLKLVGCGLPTSIDYMTSCVPFKELQNCNSACFANPSIIRCGSDVPFCVTPRFGPHGNYSIFGCEATKPFTPYTVYMTYNGQNTTGYLPRYLGEDGKITYATRTPKPKTKIASLSLTATATATAATFSGDALVTVEVSSTVEVGTNSSSGRPPPPDGCKDGPWDKARIVIGVFIGLGLLLGVVSIALVVFFVWKYRKEERAKANNGGEGANVEG